ncbi:MAG: L-ribulose-5-phosphate 3-epimerase [Candidatus Marinamargulisbacteria bacterium]|jgi:L-ribulose-5-phosphate 3-epimerase
MSTNPQQPIGIMQGRLSAPTDGKIQSFPKKTWRMEFEKASQCNLDFIEWIFETDEWENNPISTASGIQEILALADKSKVSVLTLCADYFMENPLIRCSESDQADRLEKLNWLIQQAALLGVKYINLPFVDHSAIHSNEEISLLAKRLAPISENAKKQGIQLCLETNLDPVRFESLLVAFEQVPIGVNYDTGNSAALGFESHEEMAHYGRYLTTLHIKDRRLNGGTVPLGQGDANIPDTLKQLRQLPFWGPITFQVARGESGQEVETTQGNMAYLKKLLQGNPHET